ncbi:MAG: NADH-quinone oxidoreductase subunit D-related protein [Thermoplasmataceae archaeon]
MSKDRETYLNSDGKRISLERFSELLLTGPIENESIEEDKINSESKILTWFPYGPSSGGMVESVYFDILTYGEKIDRLRYDSTYKNRTIKIEGLTPREGLLRFERLNGVHSAAYSSLFCDTCERAAGLDIPWEVKNARIAMMEIERISSHLFVVSRLTGSASQNIAHMNILLLRENLLRLIADRFGHRYFFGMNRPGGLSRNVQLEGMDSEIEKISEEYEEIFNTLMDSRIFIDRIDRTAIVEKENSSGPVMRGCGTLLDARQSHPYYKNLTFKCVKWDTSDSLSRFIVRSGEISESAKLIKQILPKIGRLSESEKNFPILDDNIAGGYVETPSGDSSIILKFKNNRISGVGFSTPSQRNLEAFSRSMRGSTFADFIFGYESMGIWISELSDIS